MENNSLLSRERDYAFEENLREVCLRRGYHTVGDRDYLVCDNTVIAYRVCTLCNVGIPAAVCDSCTHFPA